MEGELGDAEEAPSDLETQKIKRKTCTATEDVDAADELGR
jgi:hypothetical protein